MSQLTIYHASAGAGKTHMLVSKYLQLTLKRPDAFKHILAITFTNQATQEMKHRIVDLLYDLIQGTENGLTEELIHAGWEHQMIKDRAQEVLSNMLHYYSQFSVSTIDSFFYTVIQNFTQELGLQYGLHITMDIQNVLGTVIKELLDDAKTDPNLKQWLIYFSSRKLISGKNWNIIKELMIMGTALFTESFQKNELQLIEAINKPAVLKSFVQELQHLITSFETTLQNIGQEALQMMRDHELNLEDFSYGKQGVMGYLIGLCDKKMIPTKRALSAKNNPNAWCSKKGTKRELVLHLVNNHLTVLLHDAINYYQQYHYIYQTALVLNQFVYAFGISTYLLTHLSNYRDKNNTIFISDVTSFLYKIIAENEAPFIYEKIGNWYHHFFIDEFQDISSLQWQNLKPLIANSISQGCKNLIVSDTKQAIYRWRGSDWQLLTSQVAHEIQNTQTAYLIYNWRSKKHIINFNNTFFLEAINSVVTFLKSNLESIDNTDLRKTLYLKIDQLQMAYHSVSQEIPPQREMESYPGYVKISFLTDANEAEDKAEWVYKISTDDVSWKAKVKQQLPELIEKLQYDGYTPQDIALLVRNHAEAYELLHFLYTYRQSSQAKPHCKYDIIAATSLYLNNHPIIQLLICSLKYIQDENDHLVKAELCYLYQNFYLEKTPLLHHYTLQTEEKSARSSMDNLLPPSLREKRFFLKALPLYECIEQLINIFSPYPTNVLSLLQAFQDIILQFIQKDNTDLVHFLTWWDEVGINQTLPLGSSVDAMHLMTIHQAKGLQFKIVIVPFCSWRFDHPSHHGPIIWGQANEKTHLSQFSIFPLQYSKRLENTAYAQSYYEEKIQVHLDHLNLLYVAFTRPEDRLYVFTKKIEKEHFSSVAELLYHTLTQSQPFIKRYENSVTNKVSCENSWRMLHDTLEIGKETTQQANSIIMQKKTLLSFDYKTQSWYHTFSVKKLNIVQNVSESVLPIHYGQLVHQLLASIYYLSDVPNVLALFQKQVNLNEKEWAQLTGQIKKLLENSIVKSWFCTSLEIKCEAPILMPSGQIMRPDRVMIGSNEVIVIDYKTGMEHAKHIQQIQEYVTLLQAMGYRNIKAYLLYIENNKLVYC